MRNEDVQLGAVARADARRSREVHTCVTDGSGDTREQVRLTFATCDAAKAYAEKYCIAAVVHPTPPKKLKIQAYADNFR